MVSSIVSALRPAALASMRPSAVAAMRPTLVRNMRSSAVARATPSNSTAQTPTKKALKLKDVPAELYPLFVTLAIGLGAAGIAIYRKFMFDPAVRVNRSAK
ncbi:hypothetical protein V1512DRAFT_260263 [Lipomyces arxii]|uniref:uncharacterized protein n=1 Tax=Lipomyces arxii TaxID=56418 RepID=UPI0034CD394D